MSGQATDRVFEAPCSGIIGFGFYVRTKSQRRSGGTEFRQLVAEDMEDPAYLPVNPDAMSLDAALHAFNYRYEEIFAHLRKDVKRNTTDLGVAVETALCGQSAYVTLPLQCSGFPEDYAGSNLSYSITLPDDDTLYAVSSSDCGINTSWLTAAEISSACSVYYADSTAVRSMDVPISCVHHTDRNIYVLLPVICMKKDSSAGRKVLCIAAQNPWHDSAESSVTGYANESAVNDAVNKALANGSADGSANETLANSSADGSANETLANSSADGSVNEALANGSADGSVSEALANDPADEAVAVSGMKSGDMCSQAASGENCGQAAKEAWLEESSTDGMVTLHLPAYANYEVKYMQQPQTEILSGEEIYRQYLAGSYEDDDRLSIVSFSSRGISSVINCMAEILMPQDWYITYKDARLYVPETWLLSTGKDDVKVTDGMQAAEVTDSTKCAVNVADSGNTKCTDNAADSANTECTGNAADSVNASNAGNAANVCKTENAGNTECTGNAADSANTGSASDVADSGNTENTGIAAYTGNTGEYTGNNNDTGDANGTAVLCLFEDKYVLQDDNATYEVTREDLAAALDGSTYEVTSRYYLKVPEIAVTGKDNEYVCLELYSPYDMETKRGLKHGPDYGGCCVRVEREYYREEQSLGGSIWLAVPPDYTFRACSKFAAEGDMAATAELTPAEMSRHLLAAETFESGSYDSVSIPEGYVDVSDCLAVPGALPRVYLPKKDIYVKVPAYLLNKEPGRKSYRLSCMPARLFLENAFQGGAECITPAGIAECFSEMAHTVKRAAKSTAWSSVHPCELPSQMAISVPADLVCAYMDSGRKMYRMHMPASGRYLDRSLILDSRSVRITGEVTVPGMICRTEWDLRSADGTGQEGTCADSGAEHGDCAGENAVPGDFGGEDALPGEGGCYGEEAAQGGIRAGIDSYTGCTARIKLGARQLYSLVKDGCKDGCKVGCKDGSEDKCEDVVVTGRTLYFLLLDALYCPWVKTEREEFGKNAVFRITDCSDEYMSIKGKLLSVAGLVSAFTAQYTDEKTWVKRRLPYDAVICRYSHAYCIALPDVVPGEVTDRSPVRRANKLKMTSCGVFIPAWLVDEVQTAEGRLIDGFMSDGMIWDIIYNIYNMVKGRGSAAGEGETVCPENEKESRKNTAKDPEKSSGKVSEKYLYKASGKGSDRKWDIHIFSAEVLARIWEHPAYNGSHHIALPDAEIAADAYITPRWNTYHGSRLPELFTVHMITDAEKKYLSYNYAEKINRMDKCTISQLVARMRDMAKDLASSYELELDDMTESMRYAYTGCISEDMRRSAKLNRALENFVAENTRPELDRIMSCINVDGDDGDDGDGDEDD